MEKLIKVGIAGLNGIYAVMKLFPQQKKVVILSRESDTPSLDICMLRDKIEDLHPDYSVVILCKLFKASDPVSRKLAYGFHVLRQMGELATSQIAVLDTYCIPASLLKHRKNLLIVQMWHSIGTMKKFGYSILDKSEGSSSKIAHLMHMHEGYDYIFSAGEGYREHLAQGFNYPLEKIVVMPLPRVEALKDKARAEATRKKIFEKYPSLNCGKSENSGNLENSEASRNSGNSRKLNIVYVPTFRKGEDEATLTAIKELIDAVDYDKYNLVIKAHPLTELSGLDDSRAIIDKEFSSFDMLFASDIVIGDYSCIMYEAAILGKPLYFYDYDYDEYMSTRDIYMDYMAEVPGPVCYDALSLMEEIKKPSYDYAKLDSFLRKYVYVDSEHETQDMVEFLFDKLSSKQSSSK